MKTTFPISSPTLAAVLAAASLSACKDDNARVPAPEPASLAESDTLSRLPDADPLPVRYADPEFGYGYAERAYEVQRRLYDEPPQYGFAYADAEPWVWRTADDWEMYAEPWDDGYRYYYYEPGADHPYWVQDADYGYGFGRDGVLISIVSITGAYLPAARYVDFAPVAGRYYARGYQLHDAGRRARRVEVTNAVWRERGPRVFKSARRWVEVAPQETRWKAWREKGGHDALGPARGPDRERLRQRQAAAGPDGWLQGRGPGEARSESRGPDDEGRHEVRQARRADPAEARDKARRRADDNRQARAEPARGRPAKPSRGPEQTLAHRQARAEQQAKAQPPGQARAAEAQGRPAAAVAGPRQERGGGNPSADRGGGKGPPQGDRGGGHPHPGGGKGGGKKD